MSSNYKIIKRNWRQFYIFLAIITDSFSVCMSAVIAYWIRNAWMDLPRLSTSLMLKVLLLTWGAFILFAGVLGLYRAAYYAHRNEQSEIGLKAD